MFRLVVLEKVVRVDNTDHKKQKGWKPLFYSVIDCLIKELDSQLPTSLEQFLSCIASYKVAFDCLYKLLLIAVTLLVTSASCQGFFKKFVSENISQKFHGQ